MPPDWSDAPRELGPAAVASPLDRLLGTVVHAALARWQRGVDGGSAPNPDRLLQAVRDEAATSRLSLEEAGTAWARLEGGLRAYATGPWPRRSTLFLEQATTHLLSAPDGFAVELRLRVDRVARYLRSVAILDFKVVSPHALELRADRWQLQAYALAAPELLGVQPTSVHLFLVDLAAGVERPVESGAEGLRVARDELLSRARGIEGGHFDPADLPADRPCWDCGFRLECPSSLARRPT